MAIHLSDNINYNAPKHSDARYGPWSGVTEANANVISLQRVIGLTVGIQSGDTLNEYWYYSGITDNDLVLKLEGGGATGDHAELDNLDWTNSKHTGTVETLAGFDASGNTVNYPLSSGVTISTEANKGIEIKSGTTVNTIYNSGLGADISSPDDVGGIPAGTTVADLTGKTMVDLFNDLLFPTVQPTYTIPTITLGGVSTSTLEVGSTYSPSITAYGEKNDSGAFTKLRILRDSSPIFTNTGLTQSSITNIADQFGYADPNNPNYRYTINPTPYSESYVLPTGTTTYQVDGDYGAGVAKQDNKGVFDVRSAAVRSVNAPQLGDTGFGSSTRTITTIYPYFYGDMASLPTPTSIAAAILAGGGQSTKVLSSASGTAATPYNVTGRYIWVAYLGSYTSKTVWWVTDFDSAAIDGSFITTAVTQAVTSPDGYWSGINFKMHWSVYATNQTTGTFEYRNT